MTDTHGKDEQVARSLVQCMVRHGVASVQTSGNEVGTLSLHSGGEVTYSGLSTRWLPAPERETLWRALGLLGTPEPATQNEEAFFQELMHDLYRLGLGRVTWHSDTQVAFLPDSSAPSGLSFRLSDLECLPRRPETLGLDIEFQA